MFFKVIISADQLLVLIDHSLGSIMKRPYNKLLINLTFSHYREISDLGLDQY